MARNESIRGLYMRLGLDFSELDQGFVQASRTLRSNIASLSRQNTIIRLQTEVDLTGVEDAAQRLEIQTEALNRQIEIQRNRLQLATASWTDLSQATGENSDETQRARIAVERERLALRRLEEELRNLNDTQEDTNDLAVDYVDTLKNFAGKAAPVIATLGLIREGMSTATEATERLIENFRELQNQSYELNMSLPDTDNFLRRMRLAGGDIGDFEGYIHGISDAYVKGEWDDPEFIALSKYGAKITDVTGRLKDFKDITEEVYQAWKKADAAGEGIEFLQLTGGEAGVRDAIQFFRRYEEAKEDARKIFKANIDFEEFHQAEREFNLLNEQTDEFQKALANAITPASRTAYQELFEIVHKGTEVIVENQDTVMFWGFVLKEAVSTPLQGIKELVDGIGEIDSAMGGLLSKAGDATLKTFLKGHPLLGKVVENAQEDLEEYKKEFESTQQTIEDGVDASVDSLNDSVLSQYGAKRVKQFRDELEELQIEMDAGDDEYAKAKAENALWLRRELNDKLYVTEEERVAITELFNLKEEKIEQEHAEKLLREEEEKAQKIKDITQQTSDIEFEMTHTAFEKQLRDIERQKDAMMEKADTAEEVAAIIENAAMKEAEAFEREIDRMQGRLESAQDRLMRLYSSSKDYDLYKARKQYDQDIADGIPQEWAQKIYEGTVRDINKRAREDKSGNYTKSPDDVPQYVIEFGKAAKQSAQEMAMMDSRALALQKVMGNMTEATMQQVLAIEEANAAKKAELQGINAFTQSARSGIEIIQGTESNFASSFAPPQGVERNYRPQAINQALQPADFSAMLEALSKAQLTKDSYGTYGAAQGGIADLSNFIHAMENTGAQWSQISDVLDRLIERQNERQQAQYQSPVTVAPNISINLEGNVVADQQFIDELAEQCKNATFGAVTEAVQSATSSSSNNFSYAR